MKIITNTTDEYIEFPGNIIFPPGVLDAILIDSVFQGLENDPYFQSLVQLGSLVVSDLPSVKSGKK
jgi:hypothetical protein